MTGPASSCIRNRIQNIFWVASWLCSRD